MLSKELNQAFLKKKIMTFLEIDFYYEKFTLSNGFSRSKFIKIKHVKLVSLKKSIKKKNNNFQLKSSQIWKNQEHVHHAEKPFLKLMVHRCFFCCHYFHFSEARLPLHSQMLDFSFPSVTLKPSSVTLILKTTITISQKKNYMAQFKWLSMMLYLYTKNFKH